jgi:LPS-assembly lipoprotein
LSFDRFHRLPKTLTLVAGITALALLSSCQVRPLYSEASGTATRLAAIAFSAPDNRVEQAVRNHLVFLTSGGAGEAARADYAVQLDVTSRYTDVLDDEDRPGLPGRITVVAAYALSRTSDGQILKTGRRQVTSLIDIPGQEFAELRAVRDAENRAAREVAELVRADLASVIAREPQPQPVTWQK